MKSLYRDSLSPHVIKTQVPIVGYCISFSLAIFAYNISSNRHKAVHLHIICYVEYDNWLKEPRLVGELSYESLCGSDRR